MKTPGNNKTIPSLNHLLFGVLIIVNIACNNNEAVTNQEIHGDWEWIQTTTGRPLTVTTPESSGQTKSITFEPIDSARFYVNGNLAYTLPYRFEWEKELVLDTLQDSILVLVINNGSFSFFSISNDTLIIDDSYRDLGTKYYKRRN